MSNELTRRKLLAVASTGIAATRVARPAASSDKPAMLGGQPVRTEPFPSWPVIAGNDERAWMVTARDGLKKPGRQHSAQNTVLPQPTERALCSLPSMRSVSGPATK